MQVTLWSFFSRLGKVITF